MKLKDLRPILTAIGVNLYLEYKKPIEFVSLGDGDYIKNNSDEDEDTMYKEYGEYEIEQIYANDYDTINIDLVNK